MDLWEKFDLTKEMLKNTLKLVLEGTDTFSEISLNGKQIGSTDNMFMKYEFVINDFVNEGENILEVRLLSAMEQAKKFPHDNYFSCFNLERIFMRKSQCHY